ncbi:B3 DNA binding domain [Dillenia turbinata]|uniref:B3 DNA binding domain n=1 Tax=Dillenia turbinata TaxID=194707 RepID=A0AAN8VXU7_9MAGN
MMMEDEVASMVSNKTDGILVASDSNRSDFPSIETKRKRNESHGYSAKFKGVVPQQNGHWGAQIYANHQRVWLGTFKSENEAAMAYDSAAILLRSGDTQRNFPWNNVTAQEPEFQTQYGTEAVLAMIKNGSYPSKFAEFLRTRLHVRESTWHRFAPVHEMGGFLCRQIFQKELTPSDVGKLNRLVIPKKYAVKYFPLVSKGREDTAEVDHTNLVFYDRLMNSWEFFFCYWKSSQSFVFTRGWNRFVKENNLKSKDTVTFYVCECLDGFQVGRKFFLIDASHHDETGNRGIASGLNKKIKVSADLQFGCGESVEEMQTGSEKSEDDVTLALADPADNSEEKGIMLFGVQII